MPVAFDDVKEVLDYCLGDHPDWDRIRRRHRNPSEEEPDPHLFGWESEKQLLCAKARGHWLINPEFRGNGQGEKTNLVRILTQPDGLFGYPRMPLVGNLIDAGSDRCQILIDWINGLPTQESDCSPTPDNSPTPDKAVLDQMTNVTTVSTMPTSGCSPEEKFMALGDELPPYPELPPNFNFVQAKQVGEILYVSGMGPQNSDKGAVFDPEFVGKLWDPLTIDQGKRAARLTGLNLLHVVRRYLGTLNNVDEILELFGMVNGAPTFTRNPEVINGCSDLMVEIFGEQGKHVRTASGADTPFDIAVYINMTVKVKQ